jgi:hypothetical protein
VLDVDDLKGILKTDLTALYTDCKTGDGVSEEDFAGRMAGIIARVIPYITKNAAVFPGTDWIAGGQYPVAGGATGKVL